MSIKEYNKIYSQVASCKIMVEKIEEIVKDGNIVRFFSIVPHDYKQILNTALSVYLETEKAKITKEQNTITMR